MKVNVYDFDKTILPYDSTAAFFRFCCRRYPRAVLKSCPALPRLPLMAAGIVSRTEIKEKLFRYLTLIPDVDAEVALFWEQNFKNINAWYLAHRRPDDIIISASPEFLLRIPAERLGARLIASRVSKYTGLYEGANNDGEEKVRRLFAEYPDTVIGEFYSDSTHDAPLARLAESAYLVKGQKRLPWPEKRPGELRG